MVMFLKVGDSERLREWKYITEIRDSAYLSKCSETRLSRSKFA